MASHSDRREIVIIGGGIIGCTTAYYLTRHPAYDPLRHKITLLEASKIAGGASGKAGGLLALWAYPSCIVPLSYRLHTDLAKEHNGAERWGYRRIHCGQLNAKGRPLIQANGVEDAKTEGPSVSLEKRKPEAKSALHVARIPKDLDWFASSTVTGYDSMGDPSTTAQVHPYHFTTSMAELAASAGASILTSALVTSISTPSNIVHSVTYTSPSSPNPTTIPATDVVLAAGPWTPSLYPSAPISALRAHSVTIRPTRAVSAYALFTEIVLPPTSRDATQSLKKKHARAQYVTPEIYARPDNSVYACGEGDKLVPLPATTAEVETDMARCQDIVDYVGSISDELSGGEVTVRQACYLPNVEGGGGPLVGGTGVQGLVLAAGHTCWGIQNGPGTGKCVSELVWEGRVMSADLMELDPRRVLKGR